jgi:hypothetical protein
MVDRLTPQESLRPRIFSPLTRHSRTSVPCFRLGLDFRPIFLLRSIAEFRDGRYLVSTTFAEGADAHSRQHYVKSKKGAFAFFFFDRGAAMFTGRSRLPLFSGPSARRPKQGCSCNPD